MAAPLTPEARAMLAVLHSMNAGAGAPIAHDVHRQQLISRRLIRRLPGDPKQPTRYALTLAGSELLSASPAK